MSEYKAGKKKLDTFVKRAIENGQSYQQIQL